jgi:hypothetical protein
VTSPIPVDPEWTDYLEAVRGLASLPDLVDERRRGAKDDEEAALARAKAASEAALNRCEEWRSYASRALATAEARLVGARILVPDASAAPTIAYDAPDPLVESLAELEKKLDTEVSGLREARREGRARAMERAAEAARKAALRRELMRIGALILLIIVGAFALRIIF